MEFPLFQSAASSGNLPAANVHMLRGLQSPAFHFGDGSQSTSIAGGLEKSYE
jgi:hypothetical protein